MNDKNYCYGEYNGYYDGNDDSIISCGSISVRSGSGWCSDCNSRRLYYSSKNRTNNEDNVNHSYVVSHISPATNYTNNYTPKHKEQQRNLWTVNHARPLKNDMKMHQVLCDASHGPQNAQVRPAVPYVSLHDFRPVLLCDSCRTLREGCTCPPTSFGRERRDIFFFFGGGRNVLICMLIYRLTLCTVALSILCHFIIIISIF